MSFPFRSNTNLNLNKIDQTLYQLFASQTRHKHTQTHLLLTGRKSERQVNARELIFEVYLIRGRRSQYKSAGRKSQLLMHDECKILNGLQRPPSLFFPLFMHSLLQIFSFLFFTILVSLLLSHPLLAQCFLRKLISLLFFWFDFPLLHCFLLLLLFPLKKQD